VRLFWQAATLGASFLAGRERQVRHFWQAPASSASFLAGYCSILVELLTGYQHFG
jgi:hypothetical protein